MSEVILALRRSLVTLGRGRVWLYMLGPAILALIVMIVLSLFLLERLIALFVTQPPMNWLTAWGALWLANLLAALGGWLLILSASYLVAMVLTAIVITFGVTAILLALAYRSWLLTDDDEVEDDVSDRVIAGGGFIDREVTDADAALADVIDPAGGHRATNRRRRR